MIDEILNVLVKNIKQLIMNRLIKVNLIIGVILLLTACATSMTPIEVNNNLPSLTKSNFISQSQMEGLIESNNCKYVVKGRSYVAPAGLTTKGDLKNGAEGIDEWVQIDGGNSYVLKSYKWVTVNNDGDTQLHLEFDTVLCQ